ncbi:MFS transporter [Parasphingorhabdus litoris]|uniref:MFS transporter n=1 Tax=Parasphingorhabdus litoris TaxID=394733 RepID=A0ABP3KPZ7_9SPHN|nr:glycoside-pentoside-hexuronide (GPH):cation symporter [Parasphingorhabdus litoris]
MSAGKLRFGQKLGWGIGDFGFNIYWQALNLLLMPFYTDVLGLDPILAGTVFLAASLFDGFADSVIGAVADRTRSKYGSYRPYLIFVSPLLVVVFMACFIGIDAGQGGLFAYALLSQMALRTVYSLVNIPYSTLSARITDDSDTRSQLAGIRIAFAMLGGITVTFLLPTIVDALQGEFGGNGNIPYIIAAGICGILSLPIFWICFLSTSEPEQLEDANPEGFYWGAVWEDLVSVARIARTNTPLLRVFGCMIVSSLAFTMTNKCLTYYINHYLEAPELRSYLLPFALFINMLFCPIWAWAAQRWSKRQAWLTANVISILGYLAFFLSESRDPAVAAVMLGIVSAANAAYVVLVWAMIPDTVEYSEWTTGQRHDAKVFGIASFSKQAALGLNGIVLGLLLSWVGYQSGSEVQSADAIEGIKSIMTLVPLLGILLSALIMWNYRLDRTMHAQISRELVERRAAGQGG